jgi:STE24 endopeptidase
MLSPQLIAILIGNALVFAYIELRQYIKLGSKQPEESKAFTNEKEYCDSVKYNRAKLSFIIFSNIISTFRDLGFMMVLPYLHEKYLSAWHNSDVLLILAVTHIGTISDIPFDLYFDFVIEAAHGFNKKTLATFIKDRVISFFITSIIMYPVCTFGFFIIRSYKTFYLYLWVFFCLFQLTMLLIYPNFIAPLYNKFEEMKNSPLKVRIQELAKKVKFPAGEIYVMDGSKRSGHSNAYFTGLGKIKKIVFYDTILSQLSDDEIIAVLCHEFGHWFLNHTLGLMAMSFATSFMFLYALNNFIRNPSAVPLSIKILTFSYFSSCIMLPMSLLQNGLTRIFERQADRFAVDQGYGDKLVSGLIKLSKENKGSIVNDWLYSVVKYSHPPVLERKATIEGLLNKNK